jgi:hypothetical protein
MRRLFLILSGLLLSCASPAGSAPSAASPPGKGRLAPEKIQHIVREKFGRFRLCYESGLATNSNLRGKVTVKFVIDRDGLLAMTEDAGSDLPDANVVACVVKGFGTLRFPPPDGGNVTAVYPIMFQPGD